MRLKKTTFLSNRSLKNTLWLSCLAALSLVITPPSSSHLLMWKVTAKHIMGTWYATFGTNWNIVGTTVAKQLDRFLSLGCRTKPEFIHSSSLLQIFKSREKWCRAEWADRQPSGRFGSTVKASVFYGNRLHADGFISLYSSHYSFNIYFIIMR